MEIPFTTVASLAERLTRQLDAWPGVWARPADCGLGTGFTAAPRRSGRQFVHIHDGGEVELCLTSAAIGRMREALLESGRVRLDPGGDWVRVRLDTESDLALVTSLASVAIHAAQTTRSRGTAACRMAAARPPITVLVGRLNDRIGRRHRHR